MENKTNITKQKEREDPYSTFIPQSKSATLSIKNLKKLQSQTSASAYSRQDDAYSYKSHISSVYNIIAPKKSLLAGLAKSHRSTLDLNQEEAPRANPGDQGTLAVGYGDIATLNKHAKLRSVSRGHRAEEMLLIDAERQSQKPKGGVESRPAGKTILENMKNNLSVDTKKICRNKGHIPCQSKMFELISMPLCKHHFLKYLKVLIRKEFRNLYRHSDVAFGTMDKGGTGQIDIDLFMKSQVCKRVEENSKMGLIVSDFKNSYVIKQKDIRQFLISLNVFDMMKGGTMTYAVFRKVFFPYLCHGQAGEREADDMDSQKGEEENKIKLRMKDDRAGQGKLAQDRISEIEKTLKIRLNSNYESVRKAFLALDADHDGLIAVEDFLRGFGENDLNFNDLRKLIESKSKDPANRGKLSYEDFSSWVGNSIHMSEGFYFRHDSIRNVPFEANQDRKDKVIEDQIMAGLSSDDLINKVISKITIQWKTIRKAFSDINKDPAETGYISKKELKFYLDHWGFKLTEQELQDVYDAIDYDKDGKISYSDFTQVIGSEIHPGESLYFRQDKVAVVQQKTCLEFQCWLASVGNGNYCQLHNKMHQDEVEKFIKELYSKSGHDKWQLFSIKIKDQSNAEDQHKLVQLDTFDKLCNDFLGIKINEKQKKLLNNTSGRILKGKEYINISLIYSTQFMLDIMKMYDKLNVSDCEDDDAVDPAGYTGVFFRNVGRHGEAKQDLTDKELIDIFVKHNKLEEFTRMIRSIDADHNGFITWTEAEDMLKMLYPEQLRNKSLKQMLRPFCSPANRVLLDYKQLKSVIKNGLKGVYIDIRLKENIHLKQQQALNIRNLMNPTQKRIEELKQQITIVQSSKLLEQPQTKSNKLLTPYQQKTKNKQEIDQIENPNSDRVETAIQSELYHSQDHGDVKSALRYQSSMHPSQTQGQWLKNINESLGLAPQYKIKAGLRTKPNFASQLQRNKVFGLSNSSSQRNLGGLHHENPLDQYGLSDGKRVATQEVERIMGNTVKVRSDQLAQSEQKSVFDRNSYGKGNNLILANNTPQLTRVNSDLGNKYNQMKFRRMSDNPRRPITQGIAARQRQNHKNSQERQSPPGSYQLAATQRKASSLQEMVKTKLSYNWKKIFRFLSSQDLANSGKVPRKQLESALLQFHTFLRLDELTWLLQNYQNTETKLVDYISISQTLMGIQAPVYQQMRDNHAKLNRLRSEVQFLGGQKSVEQDWE